MADRFDEMEQRIGEMMFQEPDEGIGRVAAYLRAEFGKECLWTLDIDGIDQTECGLAWQCIADTPEENGMIYCPKCGGKITRAKGDQTE